MEDILTRIDLAFLNFRPLSWKQFKDDPSRRHQNPLVRPFLDNINYGDHNLIRRRKIKSTGGK